VAPDAFRVAFIVIPSLPLEPPISGPGGTPQRILPVQERQDTRHRS
jgi:hypothetical protein